MSFPFCETARSNVLQDAPHKFGHQQDHSHEQFHSECVMSLQLISLLTHFTAPKSPGVQLQGLVNVPKVGGFYDVPITISLDQNFPYTRPTITVIRRDNTIINVISHPDILKINMFSVESSLTIRRPSAPWILRLLELGSVYPPTPRHGEYHVHVHLTPPVRSDVTIKLLRESFARNPPLLYVPPSHPQHQNVACPGSSFRMSSI